MVAVAAALPPPTPPAAAAAVAAAVKDKSSRGNSVINEFACDKFPCDEK